jgi:polysaccharide biosynthesis protein PslG
MKGVSSEHGWRVFGCAGVALLLAAAFLAMASPAGAGAPPPGYFGIAPAAPENLTDEEYARMGRAQVGTLRVPFYWPHIQPETQAGEPGGEPAYKWAYTDRIVTQATINGMKVLPFVYGTPNWTASSVRVPPVRSERARQAWEALFRALVQRYGPTGEFWTTPGLAPAGHDPIPITDWQIWNEPNSPTFMKQGHDTAGAYARMLDIAERAIHELDPGAWVVSAGLFADPRGGEQFEQFLHRLFQHAGVEEDIDALGLHPYAPKIDKLVERFDFARDVMANNGVSKPIWVTELGWPTGGTKVGNFRKTPRGQAEILRRAFDLLLAKRDEWGINGVIWYTWRDNRLAPKCDICSYSGLFKRRGSPKPAWNAFVDYTGGQP